MNMSGTTFIMNHEVMKNDYLSYASKYFCYDTAKMAKSLFIFLFFSFSFN